MKRIYFYLILICSLFAAKSGFSQLIFGPDTLCIGNQLQLSTNVTGASSYYWGFCSAYLQNVPTGSSIAAGTGLAGPSSIAMGKDGNNYFIFVVNSNAPRNIVRYDFGVSLSNVPAAINLGNFAGGIPFSPKGLELLNVNGNWFGFLTGGSSVSGNSKLVRFDFGTSLSNTPTLVNFGDLGTLLQNPQDLYIFQESNNWYAYTNNGVTNDLIRLEFGSLITNTPTVTNLGNPGSLSSPAGMWPVFDGTNWHLFIINNLSQELTRLDFGASLLNNAPVDNNLGNPGGFLNNPRDIALIRDCGNYYAYISNEGNNTLTMLRFNATLTGGFLTTDLGNFAGLDGPRYFSRFLRDRDNVFCYTTNNAGNSISRLEFNSCSAAAPPTASTQVPPPVSYSTPGLYNVYFASDEGLPTMKVDCKLIRVLPHPIIEINNDTLICQGDTILIVANGSNLYSNLWDPVYNGTPPYDTTSVFIYPREDYRYHVHLEFTQGGGCAYDTSVLIRVSRVTADAGPDRFVSDGAYTVLGGPRLSMGTEYSYVWTPNTYLDAVNIPNPTSTPLDVQFYVVQVTNDSSGCVKTDTVIVRTECTDIHLPNAFNPVSDFPGNRTFGLLNNNVVKLEYFRIYNRWGQKIFETTDPKKTWDGTFNNIQLPPDNYVWIVDGYCNNGKRIRKQGTVLLTK